MVKMTNRRIRLGIDWVLKKGETVDEVANNFKVSTRRIEQLNKIFKETGEYPVLNPNRRPKLHLTEEQKQIIKQAYSELYFGAKMLRHHIKKRHKQNIPQNKIHADYMENEGIHVIAYEDDASRKILSIGEFNNATTDNALEILKIAEQEATEVNGLIQAINTDRGSQFYPNKKDKNGELILYFEII